MKVSNVVPTGPQLGKTGPLSDLHTAPLPDLHTAPLSDLDNKTVAVIKAAQRNKRKDSISAFKIPAAVTTAAT